ncbi:Os11g0444800 [Oryza sativa Japonica Group]|uniref:Os11g0444800 protein n=3 Tax=Oryza sativa TaxID=4530 RepID=Q0ISX8_ORYSJ|nr:hypothetical protein OsI_14764 [Oryza sativa Indica Group]KAB8115159.1 hypothetical protein EE612_055295 [Oryza sativa]BAF28187.1 Os11g0444800 [Oryza sativa Japonica Group]BAT13881.1 Os11g0444800 [Oryza sativa Japonica Group]|eukprot:NP_001067824.1 Os11g0444800 [Oryza sativa Japonica Group]
MLLLVQNTSGRRRHLMRRPPGCARRRAASLTVVQGMGYRPGRRRRCRCRRPWEQERPDLERLEAVPAGRVVLLQQVGEVVVAGDGDERVQVLRRELAPQAHRLPPAHLPQLPLQLWIHNPNVRCKSSDRSRDRTTSLTQEQVAGVPWKGRERSTETTRLSPPT